MNYLAHLYLSGKNEDIMVGNFIADAVKGRNLDKYPLGIQKGIRLHRQIDHFTDHHPVVIDINKKFAPAYGKYAGIVTDMVFDHFLANNWSQYNKQPLSAFVDHVNQILLGSFHLMPISIQRMMPFWVKHRWPELYQSREGILRALNGMPRYTSLPAKSSFVNEILTKENGIFEEAFIAFFKAVSLQFCSIVDEKL